MKWLTNGLFGSLFKQSCNQTGKLSAFISSLNIPKWTAVAFSFTFKTYKTIQFFFTENYRRPPFIIACTLLLTVSYVVSPTFLSGRSLPFSGKKETKPSSRPDKYTTGFTNTANDCFANSTVQSLVPLWQLNRYFEAMITYPIPVSVAQYPMPLHLALIEMLAKLQKPIHTNASLSVWELLHLLETIHQGRISRAQHDAHELMLMIIDTLEDEYLKFFSFYLNANEDFKKELNQPPHFPFSSLVESQLRCMRCNHTSTPVVNPMMMLELTMPQHISNTSLETIITDSRSESIEGYTCFVCMVNHMILNQDRLNLTEEQRSFIRNVKNHLVKKMFTINDELSEHPIFKEIIASNPRLQQGNLKATVHRETNFTQAPEIIPIHLSRSMYMDANSWRNACTVTFPSSLQFTTRSSFGTIIYNLRSVVRHKGTHSSGHYECYRKKPLFRKLTDGKYVNDTPVVAFNDSKTFMENKENDIDQERTKKKHRTLASVVSKPYWRISDTKVSEVSEKTVLDDGKAVYMLIYERS